MKDIRWKSPIFVIFNGQYDFIKTNKYHNMIICRSNKIDDFMTRLLIFSTYINQKFAKYKFNYDQ